MPTLIPYLQDAQTQAATLSTFPLDGRYCIPIGQTRTCLDELTTVGECAGALCESNFNICTGQCLLDSDCPSPLLCDPIDPSQPLPLGICH